AASRNLPVRSVARWAGSGPAAMKSFRTSSAGLPQRADFPQYFARLCSPSHDLAKGAGSGKVPTVTGFLRPRAGVQETPVNRFGVGSSPTRGAYHKTLAERHFGVTHPA